MPRHFRLLALALLSPLSVALAAAKPPARPRVAVLDLEAVQGVPAGTAKVLTSIVTAKVGASGRFEVLSSTEVAAMLGFEKQKRLLGCAETNCLAEIGGALGADYLLTGEVGRIGSRFHVMLSLADMRKARVVGRQSKLCSASEDELVDTAQSLVEALFAFTQATGAPQSQLAVGQAPPEPRSSVASPAASASPAAAADSGPSAAAAKPAPSAIPDGGPSLTAPVLASGLAVALAAGGVAAGVIAHGRYLDLEKAGPDVPDWNARADAVRSAARWADGMYAAAVLSAAASAWLWVRWSSAPSSAGPTAVLTADPRGVALRVGGRF